MNSTAHQLNGAAASTMHLQHATGPSTTFTEKTAGPVLWRSLPRFFNPETPAGFPRRMDGTMAAESKSVVAALLGQGHGTDCLVASMIERKDLPTADRENDDKIPPFEISHHTHLTLLNCSESMRRALFCRRQIDPRNISQPGNGRADSFSVASRYRRVRFMKTHDERKGCTRFD